MPGFEVIGKEEQNEVNEVFDKSKVLFRHGWDAQRNGIFKVREFELAFANYFGYEDALAVTSGTAALQVAMKAMNIGPGDEVITQAFTFVATVEAIIEAGATPVIAEIDKSLNMDPLDLEKKINNKTKLVIPVHMLGVPSNMDRILSVTRKFDIPVLEDTAWGCGGKYKGNFLGTLGDVATFSFDFGKIMTTGEGGMILTKDNKILERAKAYQDHGHENNPNLPRWEDSRVSSGFNFRMMELQGAVGLAQLKKLPLVIEGQRKSYYEMANILNKFKQIEVRTSPDGSYETCDALVFLTEDLDTSRKCREMLLAEGLGTKILPEAITWHFAGTWNHMKELVARNGDLSEACKVSRSWLHKSVALPVSVFQDEARLKKLEKALGNVFN